VAACFALIETIIKLHCKTCSVNYGAALKYFPKFLGIALIQFVSEVVAVPKIAGSVLLLLLSSIYYYTY
jgi:hypothetical protein